MKRSLILVASLVLCLPARAEKTPQRPRISGIAGVTILVSDMPAARRFYQRATDPAHTCNLCEETPTRFFLLPSGQSIAIEQVSGTPPADLLAEVFFRVDNVSKFRKYLQANQISFEEIKPLEGKELTGLSIHDPEGHHIAFVGPTWTNPPAMMSPIPAHGNPDDPFRIIHAGFIVRDRPAEDHFYKDILGFRPYWHGGMKDDKDDWVAMQVPDGTDWLEYMLNISPTADHHTVGVMNHISLGVTDIHATEQQLIENGWKPGEKPHMGRDGKWQLNLYDPNDTRIEFMEYTPKEKPCCSEFTGPHPGPHH